MKKICSILLGTIFLFGLSQATALQQLKYKHDVNIEGNLQYFEQQFGSKIRKHGPIFEDKLRSKISELYQEYFKKYNANNGSKINERNMFYMSNLLIYLESYFENIGSNKYADKIAMGYRDRFPEMSYKVLRYLHYDILVINLFFSVDNERNGQLAMSTGSSFNHGLDCGDYRGPTCLVYVLSGSEEIFNNVGKRQDGFYAADISSYADTKNHIFYIPFSFIRFTHLFKKPGLAFEVGYSKQGYSSRTKTHIILGSNNILIGTGSSTQWSPDSYDISSLYLTNTKLNNPKLVFTGANSYGWGEGIEYMHDKLLMKK